MKYRIPVVVVFCTALPLNEIYHPLKFQVRSFYTLGELAETKIKYEN
jgi:hypothetical protein